MRESLKSLTKIERMSESLIFLSELLICSFLDKKWAIRSEIKLANYQPLFLKLQVFYSYLFKKMFKTNSLIMKCLKISFIILDFMLRTHRWKDIFDLFNSFLQNLSSTVSGNKNVFVCFYYKKNKKKIFKHFSLSAVA